VPEFKTNFQSIDKDIDRWMELYGTPDTILGRPVLRGIDKANAFVVDLYFEHQTWDALIKRFGATSANWATWPELTRLIDALREKRDIKRLKRLLGSMIAEHTLRFWEYHSFCRKGRVADSAESRFYRGAESEAELRSYKKELLLMVEQTRLIMQELGGTDYALKLSEDYQCIEQETRGKRLPKPVDRAIDENCFWELIETAKQNSQSSHKQLDLLLTALETFKAAEIKKFLLTLNGKMDALLHWDVWALAYLLMGGCSDDAFEYFRSWVILQGRRFVAVVLDDIQKLEHIPTGSFLVEELLSIPKLAYENRSGKPLRMAKRKPAQVKGKQWEEPDLQIRYPILYKRYGYSKQRSSRDN